MLLRFQAPSLLTSSPFSNIYRNGFPALASCGPHAFGLKIQLQWWRFLITLPSEKWYRNDWSNLLKLLKYLMTFRLLETPFHPSYPTLSKMEAPSPLRISETWSSLQALCMAVCYTKSNRSSNSRELLGGADTTVSVEYAFFLAMVLYPGSFHILFFIYKTKSLIIFSRRSEEGARGTGCCHWSRATTWIFWPTQPTIHQCYRYRSSSME